MRLKKDKKAKHIDYGIKYADSFVDKGFFMRNLDKAEQYDKSPLVTISQSEYILVGDQKATVKASKVAGAEILASGDPDAYVMDNYGDGSYILEAWDKDHEFMGKYKTNIGDVKEKKEKKKSQDQDGDETKGSKKITDSVVTALINANTELQKAYMQSIAESRQSKTSSLEDLEHVTKAIKDLKSDDGEYRQMVNQLIGGLIQNAFTGQSTSFEETLRAFQLLKEVAPTIQPEDTTLTSVVNLLGTIFAGRAGGGQAQLTPQQLQTLQQYIPQLQGQPALPPGQTQAQPQIQGQLAGAQPQPQPTPQTQTPAQDISKSSNEAHRRFYYVWIDPMRRAITGGASDYDIGKWIIDMMEYSVDLVRLDPRNDPHPMVAGMVRSMGNPVELNRELYRFFDSIPELAGMKEKQDSIQSNIIQIYTGSPDDDADNADLGDGQIADPDQQDSQADPDGQLEDDPSQLP